MKTKLAQISYFVAKVDPRYFRFAYFVLMLGVAILMRTPAGGGTDPV